MIEHCKEEGSPDGVYLYHVADMSDPHAATAVIQVYNMYISVTALDYSCNWLTF